MKRILVFLTAIIVFLFIIVSPILPSRCIHIHSNVPLMPKDVFERVGNLYSVYHPKLPVKIQRKPLNIDVQYNEKVLGIIHFTNGDFAITEKGRIISKTKNMINNFYCDFASSNWNEDFVALFVNLNNLGIINKIDKFVIKNKQIAFYDKDKIIVIIGRGDFKKKLEEYIKVEEMFKKKMNKIKEIDLRYQGQAVIKWREE